MRDNTQDLDQDEKCVYKTRLVNPFELLDIETVLTKLSKDPIQHLCPIIAFRLFNHRIHLLLRYIEGVSLDHLHDKYWNNEPSFRDYLESLSWLTKIEIAYQLIESLCELHDRKLLFQDIKIDQLILTPNNSIVIIDLDTIVFKDSQYANRVSWQSPAYPHPHCNCCESNDIYQAGQLIYELFTGRHLSNSKEAIIPRELDELIQKMANHSQEQSFCTSRGVLFALTRIKERYSTL